MERPEDQIQLLDVVALTADVTGDVLRAGQVGTVVLVHDADTFEVEFVNRDGQTYALEALSRRQLLPLHYEPQQAA